MSEIEKIMKRMKEQRSGQPIRPTTAKPVANTYSTRVPVMERETKAPAKVPASCKSYAKKGAGAAAMTVPELTEFIKKKAPKPVFDKFARLQKKTRPALCDLLAEFEEGYRLLYPKTENKPNTPPMNMPNANNIEGMFALANKLQNSQRKKNIKKIVATKNATGGFNILGGPASPVNSIGNNTPTTPNYANYGNNGPSNEEARVRERNAYLRKLAEKRVTRDPLNVKLSAANMKRFKIRALKKGPKNNRPAMPRRTPSVTNRTLMKFNGNNLRATTDPTRGLVVSKNPRVNATTMRRIKNQAAKVRNSLEMTLARLRSVPVKNRSAMNRMRIRFIASRLADPKFNNKFVNSEIYRATITQRLGLESPPSRLNRNKKSFTTSLTTNAMKPSQELRLAKIMKGKAKKTTTAMNVNAIRNVVKKYLASKNITNYKIEGKPCMSYKKSTLVKMARLFTKGKLTNLDSLTKEELCKIIKENRSNK